MFLPADGGVCKAWSRQGELSSKDCDTRLPGVCILDVSSDLVFPAPESDLSISHNSERLNLTRLETVAGWKVNYSLQAWHRDNQSRRSDLTSHYLMEGRRDLDNFKPFLEKRLIIDLYPYTFFIVTFNMLMDLENPPRE